MSLAGNVAIVTGGGKGIGRGIVLTLAKEKADVVVIDIDEPAITHLINEISSLGSRGLAIKADVSKKEEVNDAVQKTIQQFGQINILVNNAAIYGKRGSIIDIEEETWDRVFAINVKGAFLFSKAVIPHMINQKSGKIVNISSTAGKQASARNAPYAASKFAVIGLTQSLAFELAPHNINVNAICPGVVDTAMWDIILENRGDLSREEAFAKNIAKIPLGRPQTPVDLGRAVLFLCLNDNITAQAINVCGGYMVH